MFTTIGKTALSAISALALFEAVVPAKAAGNDWSKLGGEPVWLTEMHAAMHRDNQVGKQGGPGTISILRDRLAYAETQIRAASETEQAGSVTLLQETKVVNAAKDAVETKSPAGADEAAGAADHAQVRLNLPTSVQAGARHVVECTVGIGGGATDAAGGMVKDIRTVVLNGYEFSTHRSFRAEILENTKALVDQVVRHPARTATSLSEAVQQAGRDWLNDAEQAARSGGLSEYVCRAIGNAAVNAGAFLIPSAGGFKLVENAPGAFKLLTGTVKITEYGAHGAKDERVVQIALRGIVHIIPDWHMQEITYVKQTEAARNALSAEFPAVRKAFLKDLAENDVKTLRDAGMSDGDIAMMKNGKVPSGYQVHHKVPLDGGGKNEFSNLLLIRNEPDHMLITNYQIGQTQGMSPGDIRELEWPMPKPDVRVWPGGAQPIRP